MLKLILVLVMAVFVGGPAAAVDLQPGDLVGVSKAYLRDTIAQFDQTTGATTTISGCTNLENQDPCNPIGSGPTWRYVSGVTVSLDGNIYVQGAHYDELTGDKVGDGYFSVDPTTGNRTLLPTLYNYSDTHLTSKPFYTFSSALPGVAGWGIPLLVGFLIGASYMKGKYDGRVAA